MPSGRGFGRGGEGLRIPRRIRKRCSRAIPQPPTPGPQGRPISVLRTLAEEEGGQSRPLGERVDDKPPQGCVPPYEDEKVPCAPVDCERAPRAASHPDLVGHSDSGDELDRPSGFLQPCEQVPVLKIGEVELVEEADFFEGFPSE